MKVQSAIRKLEKNGFIRNRSVEHNCVYRFMKANHSIISFIENRDQNVVAIKIDDTFVDSIKMAIETSK